MKKFIISTTINEPTIATLKFCKISEEKDFRFIVIGDKKTPHNSYRKLESEYKNFKYLSPEDQDKIFPELSNSIGWNCIQRRNIGFVYSYQQDAEIIATVDDDNIPYDNWGDNILLGKEINIDLFNNIRCEYFDPLSVTNNNHLWHRGFPIEKLNDKNYIEYKGKINITPLVQAELWDGDPDIDAICRLIKKPIVKFDDVNPFTTSQLTPFNSQNTFLHRSVLKNYSVLPYIGRMDDIWGAYILQRHHPNSIVFTKASVYQERNKQDLIKNLENEILGYRNTLKLLENIDNYNSILSDNTKKYIDIYQSYFN